MTFFNMKYYNFFFPIKLSQLIVNLSKKKNIIYLEKYIFNYKMHKNSFKVILSRNN